MPDFAARHWARGLAALGVCMMSFGLTALGTPKSEPEKELPFTLADTVVSTDDEALAIDLGEYGQVPLSLRSCVDPDTVRARQFGGTGGPIVVEWKDYRSGGTGGYQEAFHVVLDPVKSGTVLAHGSIQLSAAAGAGNSIRQSVSYAYEDAVLTRRIESDEYWWNDPAGVPRRITIEVRTFAYEPGHLVNIGRELRYQVQPGDHLAGIWHALQVSPEWISDGDSLPRAGEWISFQLPIADRNVAPLPRTFSCGPKG